VAYSESAGEADALEPSRTVSEGTARLTVIGQCFAGTAQLREGLRHVRAGQWAALTGWPGSYWAVAESGRSTAVLTDLAGTRPVYVGRTRKGRSVWSTSARALAARTGAGYDEATLTARLLCPTVPEFTGEGTAFTGVRRVPAGCVLVLHGDGTHTVTPYEEPRELSFDLAAQELRAALVTAVRARSRAAHRLTADFSGGLDSTSLALLAAAEPGVEVFAVTHADAVSSNEDARCAQRAAAVGEGLRHTLVTGTDALFFEALLQAPPTDQPFPDAPRWRLRAAYQSLCVQYGSDLHLTGSGADTLLSAAPYYLADLARKGEMRALLRHSRARARLRHRPVHAVAAGAVRLSRTSHAQALRDLGRCLGPVRPGGRPDAAEGVYWFRASGVADWLTTDARHHLAQRATEAAETGQVAPHRVSHHRAWAEVSTGRTRRNCAGRRTPPGCPITRRFSTMP
jgi:asparagine synthase (glutamine-hydrolysing)